MRNVYYQSVGNPLQTERLPATRPTIEFAPHPSSNGAWTSMLQAAGITVIIGAVMLLLYRAPGFAILDPYDLLVAVPVIVTGLAISITTRSLTHILHPAVLLAVGIASLNHRVPWALQVLVMALGSGLLVYQFGQHAVAMITTRPMRRAETAAARAAASETLLMLAGLTAIVVAAALWSSLKILIVAAWTLQVISARPDISGTCGLHWHCDYYGQETGSPSGDLQSGSPCAGSHQATGQLQCSQRNRRDGT